MRPELVKRWRTGPQDVCGQGQFRLDVETLEAKGEGCGIDYLDIQVHSICTGDRTVHAHGV